jgi:ankyrin repeat protein
MTRIVSHNLYASRCLFWTLYACRPLTVSELHFAANFEPLSGTISKNTSSSELSMLHEAAGLLTIDPMTGTAHLVHKTANEYLGGPAARVFFPMAKKHIADTCLTIITSDEVVDECYATPKTAPRKPRGGLLDYATMYWGHHARDVGEDEQTTQVLIRAFLNKLCWRRPPMEGSQFNGTEIPKQLGFGGYFSDWSALHVLAFYGIIRKAKRLIEQGANINDCDNQLGMTPLHCAVTRGNEEMVELLLDSNVDFNAACKQGNTALHMAAEQGHRKIIRTLLHRRINSRTANQYGATALQLAVGTAYDEATVPLLIKSRFDMDVQNSITGNTALHLAVELKRPRILLFLVEKGANMSVLNRQGFTPLQLACKIDSCEAVSLLLERGAKLEDRSSHGDTALHIAAMEGNWVALDLLGIGGADINAWDSKGESLLHKQARKGCSVSIASHLLERDANIEACNTQGYTPLQCAAITGNKLMFNFLIDKGANIDVETAKGETLLHITPPSNQDYIDILTLLLSRNLSANAITCSGMTPLHHLVVNQMGCCDPSSDRTTDYIALLLSHGAQINAHVRSSKEDTALHLAVAAKLPRECLVSFLVKSGASLDAKRADGKTPLHLAAQRGRHNIFQVLLDAGADSSIKAPSESLSIQGSVGDGDTALEVAQKHPVGVLWFDDAGKMNHSTPDTGRGSIATSIDEIEFASEFDEIGSTLVGEDGSTWGSRASSSSMNNTSIVSLC